MKIHQCFNLSFSLKFISIVNIIVTNPIVVTCTQNQHSDSELENKLTDIKSVSKFISDFHRKFEDEALPVPKSEPEESDCQKERSSQESIDTVVNQVVSPNGESNTTLVKCKSEILGSLTVELVNATRLMTLLTFDANVTSRLVPGECLVLMFYTRTCPFCCYAAPHFNALPRAFPTIKVAAINAQQYQSFNTQFGIAAVPTVMLFHNARPAAKFNDTEYTLEMFARFITRNTGVKPVEKMFVTSGDFGGPVPSVLAKERDYMLFFAWFVILLALGVGVSRSAGWHSLVEMIQSTWREAHEHNL